MRILVTGSSGYIGSYLARALSKENEVLGIDRKMGDDVLTDLWKYQLFSPQLIYHLAAQVDVQTSVENSFQFILDNVMATSRLLEAFPRVPIVYTSTAAVYGDTEQKVTEDAPLKPQSIYGVTKLISELLIKDDGRSNWTLRLSNVYGGTGGHGVWESLKNGGKIWGDGTHTRDYVHVEDVVSALIEAPRWKEGIYNISSGKETSVNQVADLLGIKKEYSPAVQEPRRSCLDNRKALAAGWNPLHG